MKKDLIKLKNEVLLRCKTDVKLLCGRNSEIEPHEVGKVAWESVFLTVKEDPNLTEQQIIQIASRKFRKWVREDCDSFRLRRNTVGSRRKLFSEPNDRLPWGQTIHRINQPEEEIEDPGIVLPEVNENLEIKNRVMDLAKQIFYNWGPQAMVWFLVANSDWDSNKKISSYGSARSIMLHLGFSEQETHKYIRNLPKLLRRIRDWVEVSIKNREE